MLSQAGLIVVYEPVKDSQQDNTCQGRKNINILQANPIHNITVA